jgi:hypothetical protein
MLWMRRHGVPVAPVESVPPRHGQDFIVVPRSHPPPPASSGSTVPLRHGSGWVATPVEQEDGHGLQHL